MAILEWRARNPHRTHSGRPVGRVVRLSRYRRAKRWLKMRDGLICVALILWAVVLFAIPLGLLSWCAWCGLAVAALLYVGY